jgi:hypothetical protein
VYHVLGLGLKNLSKSLSNILSNLTAEDLGHYFLSRSNPKIKPIEAKHSGKKIIRRNSETLGKLS